LVVGGWWLVVVVVVVVVVVGGVWTCNRTPPSAWIAQTPFCLTCFYRQQRVSNLQPALRKQVLAPVAPAPHRRWNRNLQRYQRCSGWASGWLFALDG